MRSALSRLAAFLLLSGCVIRPADAQLLNSLFPEGVPGYGDEQGVTVRSRARPAFDPLGIRVNSMVIHPQLYESFGYDDNVFAGASRHGAWELATQPSILLGAENPGGGLGLYVSGNDVRYFGLPSQDRTDGSAFLGGTIAIGRDRLTLGGGYIARHEDRTALDALPSDRPVAFTVENLRGSYESVLGRFTATPSIEFNRWQFDNTTILGTPVNEASRDRTTAQTGMIVRWDWMSGRDVLWVTRVLATRYDEPAPVVASNNSTGWQTLFGINFEDDTVWRYRLLGGVEYRQPWSAAVRPRTTGIAEAEITWSPNGMTTVRATAVRGIEDAAQTGLSNYTYTSAQLSVDQEYARDFLLNASVTLREAAFTQTGGQQIGAAFGAGATWLINRNLRLALTYDFADVRNARLPVGTVAGDYTRGLTLLTLRLGL